MRDQYYKRNGNITIDFTQNQHNYKEHLYKKLKLLNQEILKKYLQRIKKTWIQKWLKDMLNFMLLHLNLFQKENKIGTQLKWIHLMDQAETS